MLEARQSPQPWQIEETDPTCFIVRDANEQALAYVYFEEEPGRRLAADLLTRDEARRIAANIAKLLTPLKRRHVAKATHGAGMIDLRMANLR